MQWHAETRKVSGEVNNINLIQQCDFLEAAFVCFNLWFCLLVNIPLYFHNIDKQDSKK